MLKMIAQASIKSIIQIKEKNKQTIYKSFLEREKKNVFYTQLLTKGKKKKKEISFRFCFFKTIVFSLLLSNCNFIILRNLCLKFNLAYKNSVFFIYIFILLIEWNGRRAKKFNIFFIFFFASSTLINLNKTKIVCFKL